MSVIDAFDDDTPRAHWLNRIAHAAPGVMVASFLVSFLDYFEREPEWLSTASSLVFILFWFVAATHAQFGRLCLKCMENVPDDAPSRAIRQRWVLWYSHRFLLILGVSLAYGFAVKTIRQHIYGAGWEQDGRWMYSPADLAYFLYYYSFWVHHKLRPWCPYCKPWDGGGDHERTPTPDPTGEKVA
jgi:hypothetical protein